MGSDSVGSLLADIANLLVDGLRILGLADKRHWGPDEYELQRAMERVLNDAKTDFQELSPMLKSQSHYEHDRTFASLEELRALSAKFYLHIQNLRDWSRCGGPVDAVWVRDTKSLQRQLHRAQCRAAQRVFNTAKETPQRCLGAFILHRKQRAWVAARRAGGVSDYDCQRRQTDEVGECLAVGGFERFGDLDIAFICDFCDGHLLWDDVQRVPTTRTGVDALPETAVSVSSLPTTAAVAAPALPTSTPLQDTYGAALGEWQATAVTMSSQQPKQVVYPPIAIASHMAPVPGDWLARTMCPLCEDAVEPQDIDDEDEMWQPENRFDDLAALQEHLEWEHAPSALPLTLPVSLPSTDKCNVM
ncbi:uncharacterized protein BBA_06502 [Beauveria bassiana ARSEF 2860]|uniref:Uncharacterized protein n=1 Tax=Beauveria bassiana (strain ARSEF 2860) TaxID=655819 RepID=J5JFD2_BEAB2|nr:uncharacterized protein BBA_06502 [Beauveria bassiana ARSEF 2860]EJP64508.1 hypothetical protein BBA_06502 [Beauveria bassiana ARSEF 2860]